MTMHLRQLGQGVRFVMCRTGQKYRVVRRETRFGRREIVVLMDGSYRETTLHHACHVKPIVRA